MPETGGLNDTGRGRWSRAVARGGLWSLWVPARLVVRLPLQSPCLKKKGPTKKRFWGKKKGQKRRELDQESGSRQAPPIPATRIKGSPRLLGGAPFHRPLDHELDLLVDQILDL